MNFMNNPYFKNMAQNISNSQIRDMMKNLDSMPDDQLRNLMNMSGLGNMDINTFRNLDKNANLSDDNLNNMKNSSLFNTNNSNQTNNQDSNIKKSKNEIDNLKNESLEKLFLNKYELIKIEGNKLFRNGQLKEAKEKYYELLNDLNLITHFESDEHKTKIKELILTTRLNIANCLIKLNENELAIYECKNIIKEREGFKVYYRLGAAYFNKKDYQNSEIAFKKAEQYSNCLEEKSSLNIYFEKLNEILPKRKKSSEYNNRDCKFEEKKCQEEIKEQTKRNYSTNNINNEESKDDIKIEDINNKLNILNTNKEINEIDENQINQISEMFSKVDDETLKSILVSQGKTVTEEQLKMIKNPALIKLAHQQVKSNYNFNNNNNENIEDKVNLLEKKDISKNLNNNEMDLNSMMMNFISNPDLVKNLGGLFGGNQGKIPQQLETLLYLISLPQKIKSFLKSTRGIITVGLIFILITSYIFSK